jgi:S-DNA-T family DNA segregation ATPase FtsK/SpoIIIE
MAGKSTRDNSKDKTKLEQGTSHGVHEFYGLLLIAFAVLLTLSLFSFTSGNDSENWLGMMGDLLGWTLYSALGFSSYLLACYIGWAGWRKLRSKPIESPRIHRLSFAIFIISLSMLLNLVQEFTPYFSGSYHWGGFLFHYLYSDLPGINLNYMLNKAGVGIVFSLTLLFSLLILSKMTIGQIFKIFQKKKTEESSPPIEEENDLLRYVKLRIPSSHSTAQEMAPAHPQHSSQQELLEIQPETNLTVRPSLSRKESGERDIKMHFPPPYSMDLKREKFPQKEKIKNEEAPAGPSPLPQTAKDPTKTAALSHQKKRENAIQAQKVFNGDFTDYKVPSTNLLTNPKKVDQTHLKKDLKKQAEVLEETLLSFGIEAKVGQINCGPTITSFEVHPSIGVKVQKIKTLENDIALNMEAKSIRIIAPIPGKAAVGIEVPNATPQEVSFKEMLMAYQQGQQKMHIPILLGKAVNGDYVMSDLTKMPHCIIAGATGSGKSVCINTIVMSILLNTGPNQIKLLMVDPKKVELTPYTNLPHMIAPVITEPQGACAALNWLVKEMEKRYEILKQIGVRNIDTFNKRTINKELEASLDIEIPEKMYYIVGIIDELADLMMVSSSEIETPIARIAQMARAVGIHLILATQRPSREVITGLIKANFPTRIAFKVASRVNSQIILDETGAESLLGNGDMLFLPPGSSHLIRAQGAFIRDEDINAVVQSICNQAPPNYLIPSFDKALLSDAFAEEEVGDSLFREAKDIVIGTGNASTTFLQRKLKIGYARAASLIDLLETKGIVSAPDGAKPRKVLVAPPPGMKTDISDES